MDLKKAIYINVDGATKNGIVMRNKKYLSKNLNGQGVNIWGGDLITDDVMLFNTDQDAINWLNSHFFERTDEKLFMETIIVG